MPFVWNYRVTRGRLPLETPFRLGAPAPVERSSGSMFVALKLVVPSHANGAPNQGGRHRGGSVLPALTARDDHFDEQLSLGYYGCRR
jgi:hypothetical protein